MKATLYLLFSLCFAHFAMAEPPEKTTSINKRGNDQPPQVVANCNPPSASAELDINNVRALIQSGGDMWWDFNRSRYEVPKGSGRVSLFAGSLWLAGKDASGQFKVAANTYRRDGNDFWTGPLSRQDAEIDPATCKDYDRQWITSRSLVAEFAAWYEAGEFDKQNGTKTQNELYPGYTVPDVIKNWPGNGRFQAPYFEDQQLAPYFDRDGNEEYDWESGDYPGYVLSGKSDCSVRVKDIYGDQNIWWVFNDKGNVHTESGGLSIGMEVRAQAFAFSTTDEVNNMTFYNYELINRSTFSLTETYFGQWVDGDLGNTTDDYVGCDVQRGLGFFYNADDLDEDAGGNLGYGSTPPAIGVDFFQGPFQASDDKDNCLCEGDYAAAIEDDGIVYAGQGAGYGDKIVDNERYGMRKFVYQNRDGIDAVNDPRVAGDYYNLLRGIWKDGTDMTYGGNAYAPSDPTAVKTSYMFPGDSDPLHWGTGGVAPGGSSGIPWTESTAPNTPGDRRFVQSAGPFILGPGAVNNITVGVVWAQASTGGAQASVEVMRKADDKTQALFDSCFEISDGPHAPDVLAQELDQKVILMLSNPRFSNNYAEQFAQADPFLIAPEQLDTNGNDSFDFKLTAEERRLYSTYTFEGYQVYQLANVSVGINDLLDPDKARLVAQVDVKNNISRLINYETDPLLGVDVPILKVDGANQGIKHSFAVTEDLFSKGDARLVNHKTYYFMAVAYAQNNYGDGFGNLQFIDGEYDPTNPEKLQGQKLPYIQSRTAASGPIRIIKAIPHKTEIEFDGIELNAAYGDGVKLTRVEGLGNGGRFLDVDPEGASLVFGSEESLEKAVNELTFDAGNGPVDVKVIDPLSVKPGDFTLAFLNPDESDEWTELSWVIYGDGIDTIFSERTISADDEQLIPQLGISVKASFGFASNDERADNSGAIGSSIHFENENDQWLTGLVDADNDQNTNWIKSGDFVFAGPSGKDQARDDHYDNYEVFSPDTLNISDPLDGDNHWENMAGRTWAPFAFCSYDTAHPIPLPALNGASRYDFAERLVSKVMERTIPSVNVVITRDKALWTRCPVFEAGDVALLSQGGVGRGELRRALSVDKDGFNQLDPKVNLAEATMNGSQVLGAKAGSMRESDRAYFASLGFESPQDLEKLSFGMGWFPGYAIDVETGERLNMAFAEDSWLKTENGNDMQWNPTGKIREDLFGELRLGGKHMIYVFSNNREFEDYGIERMMPAYDGGDFAFDKLTLWNPQDITQLLGNQSNNEIYQDFMSVWTSAAWVGYPLLAENAELFGGEPDGNDAEIRLRSSVPFQPYASEGKVTNPGSLETGATYYVNEGALIAEVKTNNGNVQQRFRKGQTFVAAASSYLSQTDIVSLTPTVNEGRPLYTFNLDKLAPTFSNAVGQEALEEVNVVPNPYYAYSEYETKRLENIVKIINLPRECSVTIYTVDGTLVRTFNRDDPTITSVDWDLKNQDNIAIASGIYLIHVNAPGLGEKVIKWFGVLRPTDLNAF